MVVFPTSNSLAAAIERAEDAGVKTSVLSKAQDVSRSLALEDLKSAMEAAKDSSDKEAIDRLESVLHRISAVAEESETGFALISEAKQKLRRLRHREHPRVEAPLPPIPQEKPSSRTGPRGRIASGDSQGRSQSVGSRQSRSSRSSSPGPDFIVDVVALERSSQMQHPGRDRSEREEPKNSRAQSPWRVAPQVLGRQSSSGDEFELRSAVSPHRTRQAAKIPSLSTGNAAVTAAGGSSECCLQ
eukprot:TRINITY_DN16507_c0_g2_i2.p1 TRINITY_DN16507_c0_g2~~TRINITY_DN16507_c0_g2_i2.p1  ORF type:complete len:283 (-),score=52.25 TRINITY_DN16507_c0_g2_i2:122-850(-)